jgi:ABC-type multidrug transport system ATPase subunit
VLLLDEPYTGLDEAAAASLSELLEELATPERIVLVTLHDVVRAMAGPRRLVVLSGGRVALDTPIDGRSEDIAEAYLGLLRQEVRR